MKPARLALATAVALLCSPLLIAQAPTSAALIRHVAARNFVLLVKADGSVVGWGSEEEGLAARPRSASGVIGAPTMIELPGKARQVAVGDLTAYALLEDATVVAWGGNAEGQLGNGAKGSNGELGIYPKPSVTPVKVTGLVDIIQIEAGARHALALGKDGTVWAWGTRDEGALGDDSKPNGRVLRVVSARAPIAVPGLEDITQIAAGRTHNLALRRDGRVMAWGTNKDGELGLGTRITGWTPAEVTGLDRIVAIDAGDAGAFGVSAAIRDDGTLWMWGSNVSAMFGNGQGPLSPDDPGGRNLVPVPVKGIVGAKSLGLGGGHVAVLLGDGTLRMWGHDGWGQIGIGTSGGYHQRPVRVPAMVNVAAVYLSSGRSYAVRADGTFWIWGFGRHLGQGILGKHLHVPTRLDLP
jgi:alpha-tubulin suppressor-like RCC1 family protein